MTQAATGTGSACCDVTARQSPAGRHADHLMAALDVGPARPAERARLMSGLVQIGGGFFEMGGRRSSFPEDFDSPRCKVRVPAFRIMPTVVSNAAFARFVEDTGYRTVAEREGWSFVFHLMLDEPDAHPRSPPGLPWWRQVEGASWHAPEGPGSDVSNRPDHPATHIAWYDALAYARWSGMRLLREAEWECAARGGLKRMKFPWGNALMPGGRHAMNIWQGDFPHENTGADGHVGTAPVDAYAPNGFGLYNMTGNVWEWVAEAHLPRRAPNDPAALRPPEESGPRIQRGGSYLCHDSYCDRYHVHSRTRNDPDSTTGNCGFRLGADAAEP